MAESFDTSGIKELLPDELSQRYFDNLDKAFERVDKLQMERTLGELSDRGFLRSGDTFTRVSEDVLGPSQERRQRVILPELRSAAQAGREERLQGVQFERQKEMSRLEHQQRLVELDKQAQIRRMLMELEDSLMGSSSTPWGQIAGTVVGGGLGAFGGPFGAMAGAQIGGTLGSGFDTRSRGR